MVLKKLLPSAFSCQIILPIPITDLVDTSSALEESLSTMGSVTFF
jgi:hypothetical protein